MKALKLLCALLAILALAGGALGEESEPVEAPVEEIEVFLGGEAPEDEPAAFAAEAEAAAPEPDGTAAAAGPLTALGLPPAVTLGKGEQLRLAPQNRPGRSRQEVWRWAAALLPQHIWKRKHEDTLMLPSGIPGKR